MPETADKATFITRNLLLSPTPFLPEIKLFTAHPGSRLSRIGGSAPYWAYGWAGGAALARYVLDSEIARGVGVLDFGAGSGLVGIAAALAGAAIVWAEDPDPWARAAVTVNARANGVKLLFDASAAPDLILCGDVFYSAEVAAVVLPRLDAFRAGGARVLVGDPGRANLPRDLLIKKAEVAVRDMGDGPGKTVLTGIYDYRPDL